MFDQQNYTIVDLETTGGSPFFNRIIEVGLLRVEHGLVVEEYQTLVNPGIEIPYYITKITGLTDKDVSSAPAFGDIAQELLPKFDDTIFVAHNVGFDYGFLQEEFRKAKIKFRSDRMCTVRLSRNLYKEEKRHNLSTIIERFGFDIENRHRAFDDAAILWDFMQVAQGDFPESELAEAIKRSTIKLRQTKSSRATNSN